MIKGVSAGCIGLLLLAFGMEREQPQEHRSMEIKRGMVLINEVMASGAMRTNDLGHTSDWLEVHNPGSRDVLFKAGQWYVTDKGPGDTDPYELPEMIVPAGGHVLIWCDGLDVIANEAHTDFRIASSGEHLALLHKTSDHITIVDDVDLGPQRPGISEGRDELGDWRPLSSPTPGNANWTVHAY